MSSNHSSSISDPAPAGATRGNLLPVRTSGTFRKTTSGQRVTRFVFTLNNWTEKEYTWLTTTLVTYLQAAGSHSWLIIGKEKGENGTPHLQGACILGSQRAFSTVKMWPGFRRAHLETMVGLPQDSRVYCSKEDSQPFEYGTLPTPGKRTDLRQAVDNVNEGRTMRELAVEDGTVIVKYYKGLTVLRSLLQSPRNPANPPKVYWLFGNTGTGKSRAAWECALSITQEIWTSTGDLRWFDGYDGQRVAIFDDFRPGQCDFTMLLRILDRYPLSVPFKGGFVNWNPEYIIITCPDGVRTAFAEQLIKKQEDVLQLERRITAIYHFPDDEEGFRSLFVQPTIIPPGNARILLDLTQEEEVTHVSDSEDLTSTIEFQ